jgi:thiol-disulfide isomerase/thioredoxin
MFAALAQCWQSPPQQTSRLMASALHCSISSGDKMKVSATLAHTFLALCLGASLFAQTRQQQTELNRLLALNPSPIIKAAPENWKGKTVLAEVFTGSECPPCVATAVAFDGIKETFAPQYLAILKYHTPIPRYDPMMNHASKKRQDFYQANANPTVIFDGVRHIGARGPGVVASTYDRIKAEIDPFLEASVDITIKATTSLSGDNVKVECEFSKVIEGNDYNVVLVQPEVDFIGSNGYPNHKMVVREFQTLNPSDKATVTFNIPESEKLADEHITEWGKTAETARPALMRNTSWPAKQNKIDRSKLKVVVFVQDRETKQVHNAYVADVAK